MRRLRFVMGIALVCGGRAGGQVSKPVAGPPPAGTVAGHVVYAETRQPGRLAEITLVRKPEAEDTDGTFEERLARKNPAKVVAVTGRSGLDGSFTVLDVPPGDYYAIAKMPGYILPIEPVTKDHNAEETARVMAKVPVVHVAADHLVNIDLALHRGGVIEGRMQFEDGAPAAGIFASVMPVDGPMQTGVLAPDYLNSAVGWEAAIYKTDDEGRFRIVGLQPGKYVVDGVVETSGDSQMVSTGRRTQYRGGRNGRTLVAVYAPGVFRKKDARVIEIKGSEQVSDTTVEVRLSGLHKVRGRVLAKPDRHAPNTAYVYLMDDGDTEFRRGASLQADGSYEIRDVPPGTYTLKVSYAQDLANPYEIDPEAQPVVLKRYADAKETLIVGDEDAVAEDMLLDEVKRGANP